MPRRAVEASLIDGDRVAFEVVGQDDEVTRVGEAVGETLARLVFRASWLRERARTVGFGVAPGRRYRSRT